MYGFRRSRMEFRLIGSLGFELTYPWTLSQLIMHMSAAAIGCG